MPLFSDSFSGFLLHFPIPHLFPEVMMRLFCSSRFSSRCELGLMMNWFTENYDKLLSPWFCPFSPFWVLHFKILSLSITVLSFTALSSSICSFSYSFLLSEGYSCSCRCFSCCLCDKTLLQLPSNRYMQVNQNGGFRETSHFLTSLKGTSKMLNIW